MWPTRAGDNNPTHQAYLSIVGHSAGPPAGKTWRTEARAKSWRTSHQGYSWQTKSSNQLLLLGLFEPASNKLGGVCQSGQLAQLPRRQSNGRQRAAHKYWWLQVATQCAQLGWLSRGSPTSICERAIGLHMDAPSGGRSPQAIHNSARSRPDLTNSRFSRARPVSSRSPTQGLKLD